MNEIINNNNKMLLKRILKGIKPISQSKVYDLAFQEKCTLNSLKIDKLI